MKRLRKTEINGAAPPANRMTARLQTLYQRHVDTNVAAQQQQESN